MQNCAMESARDNFAYVIDLKPVDIYITPNWLEFIMSEESNSQNNSSGWFWTREACNEQQPFTKGSPDEEKRHQQPYYSVSGPRYVPYGPYYGAYGPYYGPPHCNHFFPGAPFFLIAGGLLIWKFAKRCPGKKM